VTNRRRPERGRRRGAWDARASARPVPGPASSRRARRVATAPAVGAVIAPARRRRIGDDARSAWAAAIGSWVTIDDRLAVAIGHRPQQRERARRSPGPARPRLVGEPAPRRCSSAGRSPPADAVRPRAARSAGCGHGPPGTPRAAPPAPGRAPGAGGQPQRQPHVLLGARAGQVERLEDEPDPLATQPGPPRLAQRSSTTPSSSTSPCGGVEPGPALEQRRIAPTRGAMIAVNVPARTPPVTASKRDDGRRPATVALGPPAQMRRCGTGTGGARGHAPSIGPVPSAPVTRAPLSWWPVR
jgi:hypothetical protein